MLRVVHAAGRRWERGRAPARCPPSSDPHLQRLSPMGPASPAQILWASSAGLPRTTGHLPSNAAPSLQICSCPVLPTWLPSQTGTWCQVHSTALPVRLPSSLPLLPSPWSHQPLSALRKPSSCPSVLSRYLPSCGPMTLQTANQSMTLLQKPNCGSIKSDPRSCRPEWTVSFRLFSQVTLGFLFQRSSLSPILPTCPFS